MLYQLTDKESGTASVVKYLGKTIDELTSQVWLRFALPDAEEAGSLALTLADMKTFELKPLKEKQ